MDGKADSSRQTADGFTGKGIVHGVPLLILCHIIKFIYGFLFGSLIWLIVVRPFERYYDFTFGHHWPAFAFSTVTGVLFMTSLAARSAMVLFLPNLIGGATQNYIIVLLFTGLLANPLTSVGLNSVESVRVIGCSLTQTFDQLSDRAKLVLNPIIEILNDKDQTDLDPIRHDLVRIQQFVGEIKQNAQLIGNNSTQRKPDQEKAQQEPVVAGANPSGQVTSKTGIELEWDLENFGVKANIDMQRIRELAKAGKLRKYLNKAQEVNLTDILYDSCLNIFLEARSGCVSSVEDMFQGCKARIGPLLATVWCAPFAYSMETFCPWIMDQLVDEKSLCKQVKIVHMTPPKSGQSQAAAAPSSSNQVDVNEAFRQLNRQISHLNEHILLDDKQLGDQRKRTQRLEIHLTFNEKTRQIFRTTRDVIGFIRDKYRMRRLFVLAFMFAYDVYTTYTFLLIVVQVLRYRKNYLTNIKYDNCYITQGFVKMDSRHRHKHSNLATNHNNNSNNNNKDGSILVDIKEDDDGLANHKQVLPLTDDESKRYITTYTCRRRTYEERQVQRLSCIVIIIFLAFTLSLFYLDDIFFSLLNSIQDHSLIRYRELGHHQLDVRVRGEGVIAHLVRRLVGHLNSVYDLDRDTSTRQCLPEAHRTPGKYYLVFMGLVVLYFVINQLSIYAMRLRSVTCAYFYPSQERQRLNYLRKYILYQRSRLAASGLKDYLEVDENLSSRSASGRDEHDQSDHNVYNLRDALVYLKNCTLESAKRCRCLNSLLGASPSS